MKVSKNMKVEFEYKLFVDGNLVDESKDVPFTFIYGYSQVIPGVEKNLEGMSADEEKSFEVAPAEGYGEKREDLIQRIPVDRFPAGSNLDIGQVYEVTDSEGRPLQFMVTAVENGEVIADFNHPLAGKTLKFDVKIVNVAPADEKEIAQLLGFATSCSPTDCGGCSGC